MKVGHFTFEIMSIFLNRSFNRLDKYLAADSLTISLIEVKGDISRSAPGWFFEAKYVAGPVPIDLPNKRMEDSGIPYTRVR